MLLLEFVRFAMSPKKILVKYCLVFLLECEDLHCYQIHPHVVCEIQSLSKVLVVYFVHPFEGIRGSFRGTLRIVMMGWSCPRIFVDEYRFKHACHCL